MVLATPVKKLSKMVGNPASYPVYSRYGTNHPQLKWHTCVTRVCKSKKHAWHQTTRVHVCKMNAPHTRTYPYKVSATKRSYLHPVVP